MSGLESVVCPELFSNETTAVLGRCIQFIPRGVPIAAQYAKQLTESSRRVERLLSYNPSSPTACRARVPESSSPLLRVLSHMVLHAIERCVALIQDWRN